MKRINITINLSGMPTVIANGEKIKFATKKSLALFIYIAIKKCIPKDELEQMFWPDLNQVNANKNLRNSIYYIKKNFDCGIFEKASNVLKISDDLNISIIIEPLHVGILEGFSLSDCEEFIDFMHEYANQYQMKFYNLSKKDFIDSLNTLDKAEALRQFYNLREIDSFDEDICLAMMKYHFLKKNFDEAIAVYKDISASLKNELFIEPTAEIQNLYENILMQKKMSKISDEHYFYGREEELQKIYFSHKRFSKGELHKNFLVIGQMGMGKTTLVNQYVKHNDMFDTVHIHINCYEAEADLQLKIITTLASRMLDLLDITPDILKNKYQNIISHTFQLIFDKFAYEGNVAQSNEDISFYEVEKALTDMFDFLVSQKKFFIVIDNLHFCDIRSKNMIYNILLNTHRNNVLSILTFRAENKSQIYNFLGNTSNDSIDLIRLNNFTHSDIEKIVVAQLNSTDKVLINSIIHESAGNPLFLSEIIKNVKDNNVTSDYKFITMLDNKLKSLSKSEQSALDISTIFINFIDPDIIATIMGVDKMEILEIFQVLIDNGFIKEEFIEQNLKLSFSHDQFRQHIYSSLSFIKRKAFHIKLAEQIISNCTQDIKFRKHIDEIIYHYKTAGETVKYIEYKIKKITDRVSSYDDYPEVLTSLAKGYIEELEHDAQSITLPAHLNFQILLLKSNFSIRNGDYANGIKFANEVLEYDTDIERKIAAHQQMISYGKQTRNHNVINEHSLKALRLLRDKPNPIKKSSILRAYALGEYNKGRFHNGKKVLLQVMDILNTLPLTEEVLYHKANVYNYLATEDKYLGNYHETIVYYEKAINICNEQNIIDMLPLFYMNLGHSYMEIGEIAKAKDIFIKYKQISEYIKCTLSVTISNAYLAIIYFNEGECEQSLHHLTIAINNSNILKNPYEDGYLYKIICVIKCNLEIRSMQNNAIYKLLDMPYEYYYNKASENFTSANLVREIENIPKIEEYKSAICSVVTK